jgi:antitoxin component of RelBE/YafQ-DinJ toxin-antitoxin module
MKNTVIKFRTTEDLRDQIREIAEKENRTMANQINFILKKFIEDNKGD